MVVLHSVKLHVQEEMEMRYSYETRLFLDGDSIVLSFHFFVPNLTSRFVIRFSQLGS